MPNSTITIDYTPAFEQGAGIGRYVRELTHALARHDTDTRYKLFVSGASKSALPQQLGDNFHWRNTRISPKWLARLWFRANAKFPIEMMIGETRIYHATDFVLPPTRPKTRTLLTVHDLSFIRVPEAASPALKAYLDRVVPDSIRRADHILADSQATKNDIIEFYGSSADKITVLLSGVDKRFKPVSDAGMTIRSKYRIPKRPFILSVGTVQPRKNYQRLIHALANLRKNGIDIDFVIAGGKGWLEDPIFETISKTGLSDHVHLIGFVDDIDLPALYSAANCVAFPSLYEGFGFPVLEGMACGTPVLTSSVSSLPEVAGDATVLVNPYDLDAIVDGLQRLITDDTLRKSLIVKGFTQAKQFTWERSAQHLKEIYDSML
ncbi:MAG: glycosyltransferase family 1 protein [Aggregatilineales bacterium]